MGDDQPRFIENRQFVEYEEEDIQRLNRSERQKFEANPETTGIMKDIERELGSSGHWEEHWLTVDSSGKRVYTRIYYTGERAIALTADSQIIREIDYPRDDKLFH